MRTTGLRAVPSTCALGPLHGRATPTELTIDHSVNVPQAEHPNTTFAVISQSLPPREGLADELAKVTHRLSLCDLDNFRTPSKPPPPKPPRTFKRGENLNGEKEERNRSVSHPGPPITPTALYELKKLDRKASVRGETGELSPRGAISSQRSDQVKSCATAPRTSALSSPPSSTPALARTRSTSSPTGKSQMAWQSLRRRIFPEDAPPLPSTPPPPTPTPNSTFYPSLSSLSDSGTSASATSSPQPTAVRPKVTQASTQPNANVGEPSRTQRPQSNAPPSTSTRPRQLTHSPSPQTGAFEITHTSAPETTKTNPATLDQGPISTISEFESTCKQVFHLQRNARGLMQQNQYSKAAIKYQMALGLIDKVLKSRVLAVTRHEATRQRLFHLQEAVFASRKESLNGFTDAQAAVDLPQELSTTAPPPGAPPSYQDVLREDRQRVRGAPPPVPERPLVLNSSMPENGVPSSISQSQSQHRSQQHPHHQRSQPLPHQPAHPLSQAQLSPCRQPQTVSRSPGLPRSQSSTQPKQAAAPLPHQPQILANHLPHEQTQPQRQVSSSNQPQPQHQAFVPPPASQSEEQFRMYVPSSNQHQKLSQKYEALPTIQPEMPNDANISPSNQPKRQLSVQVKPDLVQNPPKPKPRTSLPKIQKQPSHHVPQGMQPINEKDNNNETEEYNEVKSSQKKISGDLPHKTPANTQPQIQEEPKQPAYLRNQAQPIGDLIRQASLRGVNPDVRNQRPISLISDGTLVKSQISGLLAQEEDERKENSNIIEFKPRVPVQMSLPRPKSHYHQERNKEFSFHISEEGLYDIPRRRPNCETAHHQTFEKEFYNADSSRSEKVKSHESSTEKVGTRPRPPKPARRKLQEKKSPQDEMNGLHSDERSGKSSVLVTNMNSNLTSKLNNSSLSEHKNSNADRFYSQDPLHNSSRVQNTKGATIPNPFTLLDPFPLLIPGSDQSDISFTDPNIDKSLILKTKENCKSTSQSSTQFQAKEEGHLQTPIRPVQASCDVLQPIKSGFTSLNSSPSPKNNGNPTNADFGNSILDALDFAVTPKGSTVFPQLPKDRNYSRCHSEETLLDYSYNTLGRYLESVGSQLDVIDEFDPISSHKSSSNTLDENYITDPPAAADTGSNITLTATEEDTMTEESYYAVPRNLTLKSANSTKEKQNQPQEEMKDRRIIEDPGNIYLNTKLEVFNNINDKDNYIASPYHIYAEVGTRSSVASSSGSVISWPPEGNRHPSPPSPPTPSPSTASRSNQDSCGPWSSNNEESEEELPEGIGRSSFYHTAPSYQGSMDSVASSPPLPQGFPSASSCSNAWRDLLRIKEGVKIFFIHSDGVITSPWNRPFLSVVRDTKPNHALFLRVGRSLWSCELMAKSTLVFKSDASTYLFKETNNKPECTAVAIRVPSTVRKTQHELLWQILKKHSRIEEERPSGITKSVSKGAASAAVKVNKIVEHKESDFNQAFVRRNSIRALKGVSRRLCSLAEKTGNNLPELPEEYRSLRDAANTLRLSRSSRTVQYI